MEWLEPAQAFITKCWAFMDWCLKADIQAPACRPFWTWAVIILLAGSALGVTWAAIEYVSYRTKLAAALKAEAQRMNIADEETMKLHAWEGDGAYPAEESTDAVRRRIKDALIARRIEGSQ